MVRIGSAGGGAAARGARGRTGPARPFRVQALAAAVLASSALAVPLVRARVAAEAARARTAAVAASLAAAQTVAEALETYDLERGTLPSAPNAPALAVALAPYLPQPALAGAGRHPFVYTPGRASYRLEFTPVAGGVPVLLRVTLGVGGTAVAAATTVAVGW